MFYMHENILTMRPVFPKREVSVSMTAILRTLSTKLMLKVELICIPYKRHVFNFFI